ncbi:hypothetical protein ACFFJT_14235 [Dyella flava]|uniref:Heat induced stress protein YflT n=1 Tax=Dyella flava TaxID=1920170 RepID=A0ABS2K1F4_9GAMM|nr:hypothetical protein [Dyella flava]MBM7125085.1 hypothetical protein [Dyella flava]GLQ51958.1 hypothetical protein GCM10010872_34070 [Dyella flava]
MSDFLVAYFHTQREAVTSANKLLAYGVERDKVILHVPGEPATRLDNMKSAPAADEALVHPHIAQPSYDLRSEEPQEAPQLSTSTTLAVALRDHASINDVCSVLKETGAYLIDVTEKNVAQEYPDM